MDRVNTMDLNRDTILNRYREETYEIHNNQTDYLKNTIDFALNDGLDFGIRVLLPDILEDEVIDIKNSILKDGIKGGIDTIKNKIFSVGEAIQGLFNGNFSSMEMMEKAVNDRKVLSTTSQVISKGIDAAVKAKLIDKKLGKTLKSGKEAILDQFSKDMDKNMTIEYKKVEKLNKLNDQWEQAVQDKDEKKMFEKMEKINNIYNEVVKFDQVITRTKKNMELQEYFSKTGDFETISEVERLLAKI